MKPAYLRQQRAPITELLSLVGCQDKRRDADQHRARMLRQVAQMSVTLACQLNPLDAGKDEVALAACRSIRFAVKNAARFGGEFSLNDILAADRLAGEALGETAARSALKKRSVKKGGAS